MGYTFGHSVAIGERFGRLTIVSEAEPFIRPKRRRLLCKCDCGKEKVILAATLVSGKGRSCGCLHREIITKHGMTGDPLYVAYLAMLARCNNPKSGNFNRYGAKGIMVCAEWNHPESGLHSFVSWARANGYQAGLEIDRINGELGYGPGNCRWVDDTEQTLNRKVTIRLPDNMPFVIFWRNNHHPSVSYKLASRRLSLGWGHRIAVSRPRRKSRQGVNDAPTKLY